MREFTLLSIILGVVLGVILGAANAFVGLKYGLVVSASIPTALISMIVLRGILRRGTILENNMVQTVGSAGQAVAVGLVFTVPTLFILAGEYPTARLVPTGWPGYLQVVAFGLLGGLLGVFMMIPSRRYLMVKQHDVLPYPEGTACADVLRSGHKGGGGWLVFGSLFVGGIYAFLGRVMGGWEERIVIPLKSSLSRGLVNLRTELSMEAGAILLGVGFILGLRVAAIVVAGGLLAWLGIIPLISYVGEFMDQPLGAAAKPIADMTPAEIWTNYVRYIGAGALVFGGLIALVKAFPAVTATVWRGLAGSRSEPEKTGEPADRDLPMWIVIVGALLIVVGVWLLNFRSGAGLIAAAAAAVCGFVLVTVASRVVGYIGTGASPVSGLIIAALLGAGLLFAGVGFAGPAAIAALIAVGAVVAIAVAVAGDCAQDLKTGHLVGATPASQQAGEVIGVVTSAFTCAAVLFLLKDAYGFVPGEAAAAAGTGGEAGQTLLAPQANAIAMLLKGAFDTGLPWELVLVGMAIALVVECLGIASLPFALGLYLPLYVSTPILAGGLIHWLAVGRKANGKAGRGGVLAASGLIAGGALVELLLAAFKSSELLSERMAWAKVAPESWLPRLAERDAFAFLGRMMEWRDAAPWREAVTTLVPFALLMLFLALLAWVSARRARGRGDDQTPFPAPFPPVTPAGPITSGRPEKPRGLGPSPWEPPSKPEPEPAPEEGPPGGQPESREPPGTTATEEDLSPITPEPTPPAAEEAGLHEPPGWTKPEESFSPITPEPPEPPAETGRIPIEEKGPESKPPLGEMPPGSEPVPPLAETPASREEGPPPGEKPTRLEEEPPLGETPARWEDEPPREEPPPGPLPDPPFGEPHPRHEPEQPPEETPRSSAPESLQEEPPPGSEPPDRIDPSPFSGFWEATEPKPRKSETEEREQETDVQPESSPDEPTKEDEQENEERRRDEGS